MSGPLWAIVPMKPFAEAKHRLATVLAEPERVQLSRLMLTRTLRVLLATEDIARVAVVSRDAEVLMLASALGAEPLAETTPGLNEALEHATRLAAAQGAGALLIVPMDLPELMLADVRQIIALGRPGPCVVLAPARRDGGTNALLLNPPSLMRYAFGEQSLAQHRLRAAQSGARVQLYHSERVAYDVDQPDDLVQLGFSSLQELAARFERDWQRMQILRP